MKIIDEMKPALCGTCKYWIMNPEFKGKIASIKKGTCSKIQTEIDVTSMKGIDNIHINKIWTFYNFHCSLYVMFRNESIN